MAKFATVQEIDSALKRYYKHFDKAYDGIFSEYYEENGFDDLPEEMGDGTTDSCDLLDFDEDFPFVTEPSDREEALCKLLWKIYRDPNCDFRSDMNTFKPLKVTANHFKGVNAASSTAKHEKQLVTIYNGEMKDDKDINTLLAVSEKLQAPYLTYLADMFTRDRISAHSKINKSLEPSDWIKVNKHCEELDRKGKDTVQHAVSSFFHRIVPKLMLNAQTQVQDSLRMTAEYILAQVDFVHNMARSDDVELACPFQVDACIAYDDVKSSLKEAGHGGISDDDSDDEEPEQKAPDFKDCFGNVKQKLSSQKCVHSIGVIDNVAQKRARFYKTQFDLFRVDIAEKYIADKEYGEYPRNHRFCSFIDRRKPNQKNGTVEDDEIVFFEPPSNCKRIPAGHVPLWFFDSSATSIIPNAEYVVGGDEKEIEVEDVAEDERNITSKMDCNGALLVLSFHVEAANEIRCYMYLNGQVTRFMADDIINLLPRYFADTEDNQVFVKSEEAQEIVRHVHSKLIDSKFEAFYNAYKYGDK